MALTAPIRRESRLRFTGGVPLAGEREPATPIHSVPVPERLLLPVPDPVELQVLVEPGDHVDRGQVLTDPAQTDQVPVHAPTSATVVGLRRLPGFSAVLELAADGNDQWHESITPCEDYTALEPRDLRARIAAMGIVGLGGAGYPAATKLATGTRSGIHTLIINAAECEPLISCDEAVLIHHTRDVLDGCEVLMHATGASRSVLAIETDRAAAIAALRQATAERVRPVEIALLPTRYPSGGERQLIEALLGIEVPGNAYPTDIGVICFNVATVRAVADAVLRGRPLTSRVMTVGGGAITSGGNFEARIGTPLGELIAAAGGYRDVPLRVIDGGPMMGRALDSIEIPVSRASTCLLALTAQDLPRPADERACIRCGHCAEVCPARLQPQQLYAAVRAGQYLQVPELFDCIECGCCAYVCPSSIALVEHFVSAKRAVHDVEQERRRAHHSRQRFEARERRLARQSQHRDARLGRIGRESGDEDLKSAARAAIARAQNKKNPPRGC